jgi:hypothetical protein
MWPKILTFAQTARIGCPDVSMVCREGIPRQNLLWFQTGNAQHGQRNALQS